MDTSDLDSSFTLRKTKKWNVVKEMSLEGLLCFCRERKILVKSDERRFLVGAFGEADPDDLSNLRVIIVDMDPHDA